MRKHSKPNIKRMNGYEFEDLVSKLILSLGYEVEQTKRSGDGGIDIIAFSREPIISGKYLIQCKRYKKPVGEPVLRDLYGVITAENANKGILITNSTFSQKAKLFAENKQIELIDGIQLEKMLNEKLYSCYDSETNITLSQEKILSKYDNSISKFENKFIGIRDNLVFHKKIAKSQKKILYFSDFKNWLEKEINDFTQIQKVLKNNISLLQEIIRNSIETVNQTELNMIMKNIDTVFNELIRHYQSISDQALSEEFINYRNLYKETLNTIFEGIITIRNKVTISIESSKLQEELVSNTIDDFIDSEKMNELEKQITEEKERLEKENQPFIIKLLERITGNR